MTISASEFRNFAVRAIAAVTVVVAMSALAAHVLTDVAEDLTPAVARAPGVGVLPKALETPLPRQPEAPVVLVVGNSHTFALPGRAAGERLRPDNGHTLVDTLAAHLHARDPSARFETWRLAYPNFLPTEMLLRLLDLHERGFDEKVLVLGLTWRNVAHDSEVRPEIAALLCDDARRAAALAGLASDDDTDGSLRAFYERERSRACKPAASSAATPSTQADAWERALQDKAGARLPLLGRSADLRARIYRDVVNGAQNALIARHAQAVSYDVVDADLAANRRALTAILRSAKRRGVSVVIYLAPERTDLPPLVDVRFEAQRTALIQALTDVGATIVDARSVVPNEVWGFDGEMPDRSHFREAGHEALANKIVDDGGARILAALSADAGGAAGAAREPAP